MNKSQRIHLDIDNFNIDKFIKVKLEQNVDTLEFLTMSIDTKDVYRDFNADYGVLIGRVTANGGIGIPNAKISVFVTLTDNDAEDGSVYSIYPYKTPRDKNLEGKRYNLLPRVGKIDPATGVSSPKQPFGSFPIKEEIITNEPYLNVYKKYYKYTALTNDSGDYMIFGVPIGTQTVHLSVDITDIGKYSMNPAAMVTNLGYSPNFFTDGNTKIKPSNDLNDLPNIETQEISVDIVPFWGDTTNFEIGITRQDFRIRSVLNNTFVIFGSAFTDGENAMWGMNAYSDRKISELYTMGGADENYYRISVSSKRIGRVTEKIYYYPSSVSDAKIDSGNVDTTTDILVLDPSQYSVYKRDGDFVFIINCNRRKIITDEFGGEIIVSDDSIDGIFTRFRGFMTLEITPDAVPMNWTSTLGANTTVKPVRAILKFPQSGAPGEGLSQYSSTNREKWRKQSATFSGGSIYSIAKFVGTVYDIQDDNDKIKQNSSTFGDPLRFYSRFDTVNLPYGLIPTRNSGVIIAKDVTGLVTGNNEYEMVYNVNTTNDGYTWKLFGGNWLNFSAYLPQFGYVSDGYSYVEDWRSNTNFQQWYNNQNPYYYEDNSQLIAAGQFNTKWFARADLHWTDFVCVPKSDIIKMALSGVTKGFKKTDVPTLTGSYRNGSSTALCPYNGGKLNGKSSSGQDTETYFYKGIGKANCIEYLISLGIV
jgi:hypothetical protein